MDSPIEVTLSQQAPSLRQPHLGQPEFVTCEATRTGQAAAETVQVTPLQFGEFLNLQRQLQGTENNPPKQQQTGSYSAREGQIVERPTPDEYLAMHVAQFLTYLSRPEFSRYFHDLWKQHIEEVLGLHRASFGHVPVNPGHMTLHAFMQDIHKEIEPQYPHLNEHALYCKKLDEYAKYVQRMSPEDETRFNQRRRRQHIQTRRRLFLEEWDDIRKYGASTPSRLERFILIDFID
jgi:hypothetical protein